MVPTLSIIIWVGIHLLFWWDSQIISRASSIGIVEASASSLFFSLLVWEDYRYTIQPYHDVLTQYNSKEKVYLILPYIPQNTT